MTGFGILESIIVLLAIAVIVSIVFRRFHIPVILGYLVIGVIVGPFALGWIPEVSIIRDLAEFGVVFLMFTIGLEFSLSRLMALRHAVFVLGLLQVILTIVITTLVGLSFGMTFVTAFVVGAIVAMSSTAIVTKLLSDQLEISAKHGANAVGVLLFQDLAVIFFLILIASLGTLDADMQHTISNQLLFAFAKGIIAIALILGVGRWLLRPLFRVIAGTRVLELFTLTVLLVTLGAAWLTYTLGLSLVLGAFLAGIMLGETEFRHQIGVEIRPFRDVLLGLFFISIGMLLNVSGWHETWFWVLLLTIALVIGKSLLIIVLSILSGYDKVTSARTGIILGQGGEFGFALLTLALSNHVLPADYGQVVLGGLLISIALSPLLIHYNRAIARFFFPKSVHYDHLEAQENVKYVREKLRKPVIICGFGRVGQNVARILQKVGVDYLALEIDPAIVHNAQLAGDSITFGDATHPDILQASQLHRACAVVISFAAKQHIVKTLELIRRFHAEVPVIVRCRDETEFDDLQKQGATEIIVETFEESLMLSYSLLTHIDVPPDRATHAIQSVRAHHYDLLREVYPSSGINSLNDEPGIPRQLKPIVIPEGAYAIGRTLKELKLERIGVRVIAAGQSQQPHKKPSPTFKVQVDDALVLYGTPEAIQAAEEKLLNG